MNNYVHVWWIARDLWHHGRLPWRMPVLGHGAAYAYPYGFTNWTAAALLWPAVRQLGRDARARVLGAVGCIVATFVAFPELRHGWWAAAVLANPAIIEALLFGQQAFAWGAALLLLGVACWRRERRLAAALLVGLGQATHAAIVLPMGVLLVAVAVAVPFVPDRRALLRWYALSVAIALPAVVLVFASPGYADSTIARPSRELRRHARAAGAGRRAARRSSCSLRRNRHPRAGAAGLDRRARRERRARRAAQRRRSSGTALTRTARHRVARRLPALAGVRAGRDLPRAARRGRRQARPVPRAARGRAARLGDVPREHGRCAASRAPTDYEQLLCDRHVDFVIAYASYTASRRTNELARAAAPAHATRPRRVRVRPIERGPGHVVYRVTRAHCPAA